MGNGKNSVSETGEFQNPGGPDSASRQAGFGIPGGRFQHPGGAWIRIQASVGFRIREGPDTASRGRSCSQTAGGGFAKHVGPGAVRLPGLRSRGFSSTSSALPALLPTLLQHQKQGPPPSPPPHPSPDPSPLAPTHHQPSSPSPNPPSPSPFPHPPPLHSPTPPSGHPSGPGRPKPRMSQHYLLNQARPV